MSVVPKDIGDSATLSEKLTKIWDERLGRDGPPEEGWLWCSGHKTYHPEDDFTNDKNRGYRNFRAPLCKRWQRAYYTKNREDRIRYSIEYVLKNKYGMTLRDLEEMTGLQHNLCAICHKPPDGRWKKLHIDHDHATGIVRGLLCNSCNLRLGVLIEWSPDWLGAAQDYLAAIR